MRSSAGGMISIGAYAPEKRSKTRLAILATPTLGARVGAGLAALKNSVANALEGSRCGSATSDGGSVGG